MRDLEMIPAEAEHALQVVREHVGDSLVAAYLHGSAVAGGLRPHSDVDVLVVVNRPTTHAMRARLVAELMQVSGHPVRGGVARPLELIVFHRDALAELAYPARAEFIYGEWLREAFEAGEVPEPVSDPELTVLLAQARQQAIPLIGLDPAALLPVVPTADLRRAIGDALPALLDTLDGDEHNVLLTLARMWQTLATGEIVPKDVAAEWAMLRLPVDEARLLGYARSVHLGKEKDDWYARRSEARRLAGDLSARVSALL